MRRWHFYIGFAIRVIIIIEYSFFVLWTYAPVVSYQIRRWWSRVAPLWSRVVARSDLKKWFITRSKLDEFRIKRWCSVSSVQGIVLDSFGTKTNAHKNTVFRPHFFSGESVRKYHQKCHQKGHRKCNRKWACKRFKVRRRTCNTTTSWYSETTKKAFYEFDKTSSIKFMTVLYDSYKMSHL